jgi:bcr-type benzoyl-CoA reductase subunit B
MSDTATLSPVATIVQRCEALFEDLEFKAVQEWKAAVPGRKAIGYMPIYVPRELIHAAGMLPVGILGGGDALEVIQGDAYYQSYICRIPRSTIELGLTGRLNCLDGMLFPSICDVIRNLSGMWKMLFKDKYVRYIDVPQNYQDSVGGSFYISEMQILRDDLARIAGREITDADLNASIAVYNENRAAIADLYKYRAAAPWQAPTSEIYVLLRAGMVLPVEEHTALVREYLAAAELETRTKRDNARVVINGSTFVPGNLNELIMCFDVLQQPARDQRAAVGMRKKSADFIMEAEKARPLRGRLHLREVRHRHDEGQGQHRPHRQALPKPDLLLLSYTGCFTFMKWFELLRDEYKCPTVMLHVPVPGRRPDHPNMRDYIVKQLKKRSSRAREGLGRQVRSTACASYLKKRARPRTIWWRCSSRPKPALADRRYFGGVYYIGPMFTAFRGTQDAVDYYRPAARRGRGRVAARARAHHPRRPMATEKYRLVVEGPPNWTSFREFWKMFYDEGAVVVAAPTPRWAVCTTSASATTRRSAGARSPTTAWAVTPTATCPSASTAREVRPRVPGRRPADQLGQELQQLLGRAAADDARGGEAHRHPGGFIETDLVDPRYFSAANVKNRLESYFQMIEQKRGAWRPEELAHENVSSASTWGPPPPRRSCWTTTGRSSVAASPTAAATTTLAARIAKPRPRQRALPSLSARAGEDRARGRAR